MIHARLRALAPVLACLALLGALTVGPARAAVAFVPIRITSPTACTAPGGTVVLTGNGWNPAPAGGPIFILIGWRPRMDVFFDTVGQGRINLGTVTVDAGGAYPPTSFTMPPGTGGGGLFTVTQYDWGITGVNPIRFGVIGTQSQVQYFQIQYTCSPTLTANVTCLPSSGGPLTLTGLVNRVNQQVDVGYDPGANGVPENRTVQQVGTTDGAGQFSVTATMPALAPGVHVVVEGQAIYDGGYLGFNQDDVPSAVPLSVKVTVPCPAASLSLSPPVVDFGTADVGVAVPRGPITVTNTGNLPAPIAPVALGGADPGDFGLDADGCSGQTLVSGATCTLTPHFVGTAPGPRTATLTVTSTNGATASADLRGVAVVPAELKITPKSKAFGTVTTGTASATQTFTVSNPGGSDETLTDISLGGGQAGDFATVSGDCAVGAVLVAGASCTVDVVFAPTDVGTRKGTLIVKSSVGLTVTAALSGVGDAAPAVTILPISDFGLLVVGTSSAPVVVTVSNNGNVPETVGSVAVTLPSEYVVSADGCTGTTLAPGASCPLTITFRPATAGPRADVLTVTTDAATATAPLSGTGIYRPALTFSPQVARPGQVVVLHGAGFPPSTPITLQWFDPAATRTDAVTTAADGTLVLSVLIGPEDHQGPWTVQPVAMPAVLDEPRPIAPLLIQAITFRPQNRGGRSISATLSGSSLVTRG